jgi:hypothetical protein
MLKRKIEVWDDGAWVVTEMQALLPGQTVRMFDKEGDHLLQVGACEWTVEGPPTLQDGVWGVIASPDVYDDKVLLTEIED